MSFAPNNELDRTYPLPSIGKTEQRFHAAVDMGLLALVAVLAVKAAPTVAGWTADVGHFLGVQQTVECEVPMDPDGIEAVASELGIDSNSLLTEHLPDGTTRNAAADPLNIPAAAKISGATSIALCDAAHGVRI